MNQRHELDTNLPGNPILQTLDRMAGDAVNQSPSRQSNSDSDTARDERIRALAKQQHHADGECEIDSEATISEGDDNGAYVAAWVWADFSGTELNKEEERGHRMNTPSLAKQRAENRKRAERAAATLKQYGAGQMDDEPTWLTDLLADLMHFCYERRNRQFADDGYFDDCLRQARAYFTAEITGREP